MHVTVDKTGQNGFGTQVLARDRRSQRWGIALTHFCNLVAFDDDIALVLRAESYDHVSLQIRCCHRLAPGCPDSLCRFMPSRHCFLASKPWQLCMAVG